MVNILPVGPLCSQGRNVTLHSLPEFRQIMERNLMVAKEERQAVRVKITFKHKAVENEIKAKVQEAINKAAKEANLKGVISDTVVLYSDGMPDITESVMKILDGDLSTKDKKKPAPSKPSKKSD